MTKLLAEELYYLMVLGRNFEMAAKEHYLAGEISGFLHLDFGQEGLSVAAMKAFERGDVFSTYREHVMALSRGVDLNSIMAELFGKKNGISGGKGGSMHLFDPSHFFYGGDAIVGGHLPTAVGCAYARKFQGEEDGVMVVFGDGASNGGAFFESLNIAATQKLPMLFLCENNQYAIGTHISQTSPFKEQRKKAEAYMPTYSVDGMDAEAVYAQIKEAQNMIQAGHGPIFVEAMTCRFEGHSVADSNSYRSTQEMKQCRARDPIVRMKKRLLEVYESEESLLSNLEAKAQKAVEDAVSFAQKSPEPEQEALYENIFIEEGRHALS